METLGQDGEGTVLLRCPCDWSGLVPHLGLRCSMTSLETTYSCLLGLCLCECLKRTESPVFMGCLSNMQNIDCVLLVPPQTPTRECKLCGLKLAHRLVLFCVAQYSAFKVLHLELLSQGRDLQGTPFPSTPCCLNSL